jgi:lipopolysaccharide transport system ATP-binding protein
MSPEPVIRVRDLEKRYRVWTHAPPTNLKERVRIMAASLRAHARLGERAQFRHEVWALRGVSFDVRRGEVLGVIGHNGAGKSTLLAILSRITEPSAGRAEIHGRVSSLLEVGTGFHPELSGRDNVLLNGAILGMSRAETKKKFDEIVEFSGVRDFIDIPVKRYSSGMQVRLAFAVAAHLDPEVLLLDEVLAVGDAAFQAKCHARIEEISRSGRTVLFVSHDVASVARLCEKAIVLHQGRIAYEGPAEEAAERYLLGGEERLDTSRRKDPRSPVSIGRVEVRSADGKGAVRIGAPLQIGVEIDAREATRLSDLRLELAINHPTGLRVVLSTDLEDPGRLAQETVAGRAALVCMVEELPLKPGTYSVGVLLSRHGELIDKVDRAADFTLLSAPFYASGSVPSNYPAPVLVRHSWVLEELASPEIDACSEDATSAATVSNARSVP